MHARCRLTLLLTAFAFLAPNAAASGTTSTTLSREIPLANPALGPAARDQQAPACASDGDQYLVAWIDDRGGVRGTRVAGDGHPLDPTGILIGTSGYLTSPPRVLFDGTSYVVFSGDLGAGTVTMARVSRDGVVTQRDQRIALPSRFHPSITQAAWNGRVFLVAWIDYRLFGPSEFHTSALEPDGVVIRDGPAYPIAIASDGIGFLTIGITTGGSLIATSFDPAGNVIEPAIPIDAGTSLCRWAGLAWNGDHYLLVRFDNGALVTQSLARDGHPLDIPHHVADGDSLVAQVASAGGEFLLCWPVESSADEGKPRDLYAIHLHADGRPVETEPFPLSVGPGDQYGAVVASNGSSYLASWQGAARFGDWNIFGRTLGLADRGGNEMTLALSAAWQEAPAVAASADAMLAAWYEWRNGRNEATEGLTIARIGPDGEVIDRVPVNVTRAPSRHAVASDGRDFLVAWHEGNAPVRAAVISAAGDVVRTLTIDESFGYARPAVAYGAGVYLVAWQAGDGWGGVFVARIDRAGTLLDMPLRIGDARQVAVAFDGRGFVVVHDAPASSELRVERVTPQMRHIDSRVVAGVRAIPSNPAVACHDGHCVVVWVEFSNERYVEQVRGVGLADGLISAPFSPGDDSEPDVHNQTQPSVVWHRESFTVAWSEERDLGRDLVARRVAANGMFASGIFGLTSSPEEDKSPALVVSPNGSLAVAYERVCPEADYGNVSRAFLRLLGISRRSRPARPGV